MDEIGTDLFDTIGKKWLATVDLYSGYAWLTQLNGTHTVKITKELSNILNSFGWPNSIRTDGGPQFRQEFADFCKANSIQHELASAHNPESNGLAEAAVKKPKSDCYKNSRRESKPRKSSSCLEKHGQSRRN